ATGRHFEPSRQRPGGHPHRAGGHDRDAVRRGGVSGRARPGPASALAAARSQGHREFSRRPRGAAEAITSLVESAEGTVAVVSRRRRGTPAQYFLRSEQADQHESRDEATDVCEAGDTTLPDLAQPSETA